MCSHNYAGRGSQQDLSLDLRSFAVEAREIPWSTMTMNARVTVAVPEFSEQASVSV